MNFGDIFKKSFLSAVQTGDISTKKVILTFLMTCLFAAYIFVIYRLITRKTFYNNNFNISLAAVSVIVAAIIMTIQSSLVVSLGMVGALSIVRFRTAIKEPMDLVFLFWAISIGIICGAGLYGIAIVCSLILTVGIIVLNKIPVAKAPLLLVIHGSEKTERDAVIKVIQEHSSSYRVRSQTMEIATLDMIVEVRTKDGNALLDSVKGLNGITRCSMISHDGEVTF